MTWTLRLYDEYDVEIAYVTADPYEYTMTHPGDGWDKLERHIDACRVGLENESGPDTPEFESQDFEMDISRRRYHEGKSLLELAQNELHNEPGVARTELNDE